MQHMPPPGGLTTVPPQAKVVMETPNEMVVQSALDPNMKIKKNYERPKLDTSKED